ARERRTRRDQQDECADELNGRAENDRQIYPRDRLHERSVGRESRENFACPRHFEESRIHADHAAVHVAPQVRDHAFTEPRHEVEPQRGEDAEDDCCGEKCAEVQIERGAVLDDEALVDDVAKRERQYEHRPGCDQERTEREQERPLVAAQIRPQRAQRFERTSFRTIGATHEAAALSEKSTTKDTKKRHVGYGDECSRESRDGFANLRMSNWRAPKLINSPCLSLDDFKYPSN